MLVDSESDHDVSMYIIYTYKPLHVCVNIHTYNISKYCVYAVCVMFVHMCPCACVSMFMYTYTYLHIYMGTTHTHLPCSAFPLCGMGYMAIQKGKGQKQQRVGHCITRAVYLVYR